jgi:hypothetical protein
VREWANGKPVRAHDDFSGDSVQILQVIDVLTQMPLKVFDVLTVLGHRWPDSYQLTAEEETYVTEGIQMSPLCCPEEIVALVSAGHCSFSTDAVFAYQEIVLLRD